MARKICIGIILIMLFLSGCGKKNYDDVIDKTIEFNHEICKQYYNSSGIFDESSYWLERDKVDFTIWEDENNYYVLTQRYSEYEGEKIPHADGYKIGKENEKVTSSPDDRTQVVEYWQNNKIPVYEERNVGVDTDSISSDMR